MQKLQYNWLSNISHTCAMTRGRLKKRKLHTQRMFGRVFPCGKRRVFCHMSITAWETVIVNCFEENLSNRLFAIKFYLARAGETEDLISMISVMPYI